LLTLPFSQVASFSHTSIGIPPLNIPLLLLLSRSQGLCTGQLLLLMAALLPMLVLLLRLLWVPLLLGRVLVL
jgi:hypothetical protein